VSGDLPDAATLPELDPVIHAQARLRVVAMLSAIPEGDKVAFPRLQELLDMTAGNLSTHLRRLEEAGYVDTTKAFQGRTPVTWIALTRKGRVAFDEYTAALRAYLPSAADGA
jgi:DNA-binding transcriptional ArsR family regulator